MAERFVPVVFAAGLVAGCGRAPEVSAARPNVLLVSIDSLRPDHLSCYGYERQTSPEIDRLAREGVRFATVASSSSWTLPAHVTMLTGLSIHHHGVSMKAFRLSDEITTLAEVLRASGYQTAGFTIGLNVHSRYGLAQGFDVYDDSSFKDLLRAGKKHSAVTSPQLLGRASRWLEDWSAGTRARPFFVFLHLWDVHYDYAPPAPFDTLFDPEYSGAITSDNHEKNPAIHARMAKRDLEHIVALYDGEIRYTDGQLGTFLERLRSLGELDRTLVVVTADHGDEFFEHGSKGHQKNLFDSTLLVPLILRLPGRVPAGRVVASQARLMDVPVTILSVAGIAPPPEFAAQSMGGPDQSRDLSELWAGAAEEPAVSELMRYESRFVALRTAEWKWMVEYRDGRRVGQRLYHLESDRDELRDAAGRDPALEKRLDAELARRRGAPRVAPVVAPEMDPELRRQLEALGYLQ